MKLNKKELFKLLAVQSESGSCEVMADHITAVCRLLGAKVESDIHGSLYVTKGDPTDAPAVVAHMDTVHAIVPGDLVPVEIDGRVTGINSLSMRQSGIGGDDKCGIWAALRCIADCPNILAAFFVDEEVGCVGSYKADLSFFDGARFILQADRRGSKDFVRDIGGAISSKAFQKAVAPLLKDHGFRFANGAMTDVMALSESGVGVSCANLSAGYYAPHTAAEYIVLAELENTIALMVAICHNVTEKHKFTPRIKNYTRHGGSYWGTLPAAYTPPKTLPATQTAAQNMAARWADWEKEPARGAPEDDWGPSANDDWKERESRYLDWYRQNRD